MGPRCCPHLLCAILLLPGPAASGTEETIWTVRVADDRDWARHLYRHQSRMRLRMAAFMKTRFEMEGLIAAGELHRAFAKLPLATKRAHAANELSMPRAWRDLLNTMGIQRLAAAEKMIERGDVASGLLEIQLITVLRGLPVARTATERMIEARRDPALQQALLEADAEALYQEAQNLLWRGVDIAAEIEEAEFAKALEGLLPEDGGLPDLAAVEPYMFEPIAPPPPSEDVVAAWALSSDDRVKLFDTLEAVVQRFPETRAGFIARWTLESLQADSRLLESVARQRDERAARILLTSALNFRANQRLDEATLLLLQIIRDHPQSEAAAEAKVILNEVPDG